MNVALSNFAKEHQFREDKKRGVITGRQNGYEFVASERENKEIAVLFSAKSDYDKKEGATRFQFSVKYGKTRHCTKFVQENCFFEKSNEGVVTRRASFDTPTSVL